MKKHFCSILQLLVVALLLSGIASCNKGSNPSDSIIGQWKLVEQEIVISAIDGTVIRHEKMTGADVGNWIYEYKSDGTCSMNDNGHVTDATYMKLGNTLVIVYKTFDHSEECTIEELTSSRLVLVANGISGSEKYYTRLVCERI